MVGVAARASWGARGGKVITADANHISADFAAEADKAGAFWLLLAKGQPPRLHRRLTTLPWSNQGRVVSPWVGASSVPAETGGRGDPGWREGV
ncbi:hypothetical protein ACWDKQ_34620, partial [Saccharopolyspora sp. NPDC000995]